MDRATYIHLLETHRDRVYSYAAYFLRHPQDAEDVTQETFLRLWKSGADLLPDMGGPWLMRVARNLCVDWSRRRQAQRRNFGHPDADAVDFLPARNGGAGPRESGLTELTDRQADLLAALDTLSPPNRQIVMMHYFQGLKLVEIALILGRNISSVKVQVHRARKSLRLVLESNPGLVLSRKRETG